ncbi:hypothetical protein RJ639_043007 [Escallonia herrerae]|uniref:ARID domain-containing protein n=1 Tax=Escallonia herrerae TaxID=1293975 RepID=A0AA88WF60_9ASTE|nr:hypothetical protein RJ639_043007 [Escallonia herrerae]
MPPMRVHSMPARDATHELIAGIRGSLNQCVILLCTTLAKAIVSSMTAINFHEPVSQVMYGKFLKCYGLEQSYGTVAYTRRPVDIRSCAGVPSSPLGRETCTSVNNGSMFKTFPSKRLLSMVVPTIGGKTLDLHRLFVEVTSRGGILKVLTDRKWKEVILVFRFPSTITSASFVLRKYYMSLLYDFEQKNISDLVFGAKESPGSTVNGSAPLHVLEDDAPMNQFSEELDQPLGYVMTTEERMSLESGGPSAGVGHAPDMCPTRVKDISVTSYLSQDLRTKKTGLLWNRLTEDEQQRNRIGRQHVSVRQVTGGSDCRCLLEPHVKQYQGHNPNIDNAVYSQLSSPLSGGYGYLPPPAAYGQLGLYVPSPPAAVPMYPQYRPLWSEQRRRMDTLYALGLAIYNGAPPVTWEKLMSLFTPAAASPYPQDRPLWSKQCPPVVSSALGGGRSLYGRGPAKDNRAPPVAREQMGLCIPAAASTYPQDRPPSEQSPPDVLVSSALEGGCGSLYSPGSETNNPAPPVAREQTGLYIATAPAAVFTSQQSSRPRCAETTKKKTPCSRLAKDGSLYCLQHAKINAKKFGANAACSSTGCVRTTDKGSSCKRKAVENCVLCWQHERMKERKTGCGSIVDLNMVPR